MSTCARCEGAGKYQSLPGTPVKDCAVCNGTGRIEELSDLVKKVREQSVTLGYTDTDALALCAAVERLQQRCNTLVEMCGNLETVAETADAGARKAIAERDAAIERLREQFTRLEHELHESTVERNNAKAHAKAGRDFKAFVHRYLTAHGVPEGDPANQHQIEGCRIGARLDLLFAERDAALAEVERLQELVTMARNLEADLAAARQVARELLAMPGQCVRCVNVEEGNRECDQDCDCTCHNLEALRAVHPWLGE